MYVYVYSTIRMCTFIHTYLYLSTPAARSALLIAHPSPCRISVTHKDFDPNASTPFGGAEQPRAPHTPLDSSVACRRMACLSLSRCGPTVRLFIAGPSSTWPV